VPIPDHVQRFWHGMDQLMGSVEPTPWGAVVSDGRYPAIWDANYARVDAPAHEPGYDEVAEALLPALERSGATWFHVVTFDPEGSTRLLSELSGRGHRLSFDLVMDRAVEGDVPRRPGAPPVEQLRSGDELWERVGASLALFGIENPEAVAQLAALESQVMGPGGKRWFGVRDGDGQVVSLAALLLLEGVGYIDNVVTFPAARRRGLASAVTAHLVEQARSGGAGRICLFADPDEAATVGMYERLGFRAVGRLPSTRGPIPEPDQSPGSTNL
jgi:ribosomal protein S18 acetylase RimI-like enzyme